MPFLHNDASILHQCQPLTTNLSSSGCALFRPQITARFRSGHTIDSQFDRVMSNHIQLGSPLPLVLLSIIGQPPPPCYCHNMRPFIYPGIKVYLDQSSSFIPAKMLGKEPLRIARLSSGQHPTTTRHQPCAEAVFRCCRNKYCDQVRKLFPFYH